MATQYDDLLHKISLAEALEDLTGDYIIVPRNVLLRLIGDLDPAKAQAALLFTASFKGHYEPRDNSFKPFMDLKAFRKKYGITQEELAQAAEMKQPDISDFERHGPIGFSDDRVQRIINSVNRLKDSKGNPRGTRSSRGDTQV